MRRIIALLLPLLAGLAVVPASAQTPPADANAAGRQLVMSRCFQCHTDTMFRDQRQDRRAWEATIYRMIGRGGLYTPDEIKLMADYLATDFGPDSKPASPAGSK